jgi:16S rRNA (cytosine1402-N4)-methyltransferase
MTGSSHIPVLLHTVLKIVSPRSGRQYIDGTAGGGGHSAGILERSKPDGRLLALDADEEAVKMVTDRLRPYGDRVTVVHANFRDLDRVARVAGFASVDGVVLDLGFSSHQLDHSNRGLSFQRDEPLDMRFDRSKAVSTAADLLSTLTEKELETVIRTYGEDPRARRIAQTIVRSRAQRPITTAAALRRLVHEAVGGRQGRKIDPATRTFQALRIAVNDELSALERVLPQAVALLDVGGRLAIISFHSLEDRCVKRFFARESRDCVCPPEVPVCNCGHRATLSLVTPSPIVPSAEEQASNPRSRSAKLRVAMRLAA